MSRRAEHRRRGWHAAKGRVDPRLHDRLRGQRMLPADYPNRYDRPRLSSRERGTELLQFLRRTKVTEAIQRRLNSLVDSDGKLLGPRPGPQSMITVEMMLLAILIAADDNKSYRRTDISRVLTGLDPEVAQAVGLIDEDYNLIVPRYKALAAQFLNMENVLSEGWTDDSDQHFDTAQRDLQWLINRFIKVSIPSKDREKITNVTVDDTDLPAWGDWNKKASFKDMENDPTVKYLRESLEDPNKTEPTARTIRKNIEKAIRKGLEIGLDGRIIYGTDDEARAGHKSRNADGPAGPYNGYVGRIAVASATIGNFRNPNKVKLYPVTPYITALMVDPGGVNPGPAGVQLARLSRQVAPNIGDVTADRGFTMKPTFLRELHQDGLNVIMDYTKTVVNKSKEVSLGKRDHLATMHCGTILAPWTPDAETKPLDRLKRQGKESELAKWYADRYRAYAYTPATYYPDGSIQFRTPLQAGKVTDTPATEGAGDYSKPMLSRDVMGKSASYGTIKVPVEERDHWQSPPYGTPAWHTAYHKGRSTVENAIGRLKDHGGLARENCHAMGLAPITMSMMSVVIIRNLNLASDKEPNEVGELSDDGGTRPPRSPSGSTPRSVVRSRTNATRSVVRSHRSATPTRAPP